MAQHKIRMYITVCLCVMIVQLRYATYTNNIHNINNNNVIVLLDGVSGFSTTTTTTLHGQYHTVQLKRTTLISAPTPIVIKRQPKQHQRHRILSSSVTAHSVSVSASFNSNNNDFDDLDDLDSCTVKELKQMLKDNKLDQRGVLSKLRRKEDLIQYLQQHLRDVNDNENNNSDEYDEDTNDSENGNDINNDVNSVNDDIPDFTVEYEDGDNEEEEDDKMTKTKTKKKKVLPTTSSEQGTNRKQITAPSSATATATVSKEAAAATTTTTKTMSSVVSVSTKIASLIPSTLQARMTKRGITSLLPIQQKAFARIYEGDDAILHSPTGSGKTLAFVLPLLSTKTHKRKWQRTKKVASPRIITLCPSRELAKQVGKEYTKFAAGNSNGSKGGIGVVTVFGGIPLERHVLLLKYKPQIVVATPGRLRELVRKGHLTYAQVATLVIDEADLLLNKADSPDVFAIIEDIEQALENEQAQQSEQESESEMFGPEYQMVLVSATIGQNVREFAQEMEFSSEALIRVDGNSDSKTLVTHTNQHLQQQTTATATATATSAIQNNNKNQQETYNAATVGHWHMSCKSSVRPEITANLVSVLSPRLTIVFVPTKADTETMAAFLSEKCRSGMHIRILHGDMSQSARSRCISFIREEAASSATTRPHQGQGQILVATDVASRGLDFPNVDLVVQYGLPKMAGKEGTISAELYAHRTGRTGRYQMGGSSGTTGNNNNNNYRTSNAVALYDPGMGEGKLLATLVAEVWESLEVKIQPMAIPSSQQVVDAAYTRLSQEMLTITCTTSPLRASDTTATTITSATSGEDAELSSSSSSPPVAPSSSPEDLAMYFRQQLEADARIDTSDPTQLLQYLSTAMVALSKLDPSLSPLTPHASLLTGDRNYQTLRVWYQGAADNVVAVAGDVPEASSTSSGSKSSTTTLTPPMVIAFCKARGSGKLGRVVMCKDGSAVFDLPKKRARRLLEAVMIHKNGTRNSTSTSTTDRISSSSSTNAHANKNDIVGDEGTGCYNLEMLDSLPEM